MGIVYIPPETSTREKRLKIDHFKILKETTAKLKNENIILVGDFNSRTTGLDDTLLKEKHGNNDVLADFYSKIDSKRCNQDLSGNKYGKKLIEHCVATRSFIVNGRTVGDFQGKLTCHEKEGSSTVDYAVVNESLQTVIRKFEVLDTTVGSDHCPIVLEINKKAGYSIKKKSLTKKASSIYWNDENKQKFLTSLSTSEVQNSIVELENMIDSSSESVEPVIEKLTELFTLPFNGNGKGNKKPKHRTAKKKMWYDKSCFEVSQRLKLTTKLLAKSPKCPHLRGSFCKTSKEYKKLLKWKKNEWKKQTISKLENIEKKDPAEYWKLVDSLKESKQSESHFEPEIFTQFFEKLYAKTEKENEEVFNFVQEFLQNKSLSSEPDFTLEELKKAIKSLKNNKSAGPDRIPAEMFKVCPDNILNLILKIMNKIKSTSEFPLQWGLGITSLLLKDGNDEDPNNYRAITVTAALSKILAVLINERLEKWITEKDIMRIEQIGFKKEARPADHLFVLKSLIDSYHNAGKKIYACFVDFQKAFDCVWRIGLIYKLIKYGMSKDLVKLIQNMYERTSQSLKINQGVTKPFKTYRGVRQGCILSPRLFNLFINDLPDIFDKDCDPVKIGKQKLNCLMYADDLILLSESPQGLQNCLDRLKEYTSEWDLNLNLKKNKIMVFQRGGAKCTTRFFFGHNVVEYTTQYKYLGTIITDSGNFKLNNVNVKKKGLRASYLIMRNIGRFCKPSTAIRLFEKIVEPVLLYNCEVSGAYMPKKWDLRKFQSHIWETGKEMNQVVLSYLRQILGVNKKSTNMAIFSEVGKYPICIRIYEQIFKYWIRVSTSSNDLLREAYQTSVIRKDKQCWTKIVNFLRQTIKITKCPNIDKSKNNDLIKSFKVGLRKHFEAWWTKQAVPTGTNKLDFFYRFKKCFKYEPYLDNLPRHLRTDITKFRISNHCLPIEIQRYRKKRKIRLERKCDICNLDECGDEIHYLLRCTNSEISHSRDEFMKQVRSLNSQFSLFTNENIIDYCMNMADPDIQGPIAKFVKIIFITFREESQSRNERKNDDIPVKTRSGRLVKKPVKLNL